MNKIKNIIITAVFVLIIGGFSIFHIILPDGEVSEWERRKLQQLPEASLSTLFDGYFMNSFETYLTDQFPLRDTFRTLKASFHFNVLGQKDNNDIVVIDGYASKLDRKINGVSVKNFTQKITKIYDTYLKDTDCRTYFSLVPDKNTFLTEGTDYPHFEYEELYDLTVQGLPYNLKKIEIKSLLDDWRYYKTDSHWRQDEIVPVANKIREKLGIAPLGELTMNDAGDFYGVYYGQSALPLEADRLIYLSNDEIDCATVTNIENDSITKVYDLSKLEALDRYDIFLSGALSIIEIDNPMGAEDKELIIFRDSFGSSLAPLLIPGYSKVTLIDTRYIPTNMIKQFVSFDKQDVLFIYGTGIVNNSSSLR